MLDMLQYTVLPLLWQAGLNTLIFLAVTVLPMICLCVLLLLIGRWMNQRLFKSFGWRGVLPLAWLGTPVHEGSHLIGCIIGRNKINDYRLFKPDKKTGSLGYVLHTYDRRSIYQRFIGNTLISVAPFFGGSLVIYLLTWWFYPQLLTSTDEFTRYNWHNMSDFSGATGLLSLLADRLQHFWATLFVADNTKDYRFWLYLFAMLSVTAHLSPSKNDFEGFWVPVILLLLIAFGFHIVLEIQGTDTLSFAGSLRIHLSSLNALLILSLFFLISGAAAVGLLTLIWNWLTK